MEGKLFEDEFAKYCRCDKAVAVANGTVALELALLSSELCPGAEIITTPRSYFATTSAIVLHGFRPVFADVDIESQNITAETIAEVITSRTRAIVVVHLAGWPADMPNIVALARRHNLLIIEDCAQAHGARIDDQIVGTFGDVGVFSFCQDKIISTGGEGGMVITNRDDIWRRCWMYKDHGKSIDAISRPSPGAEFRWLHESFGSNWRLTEMQSAIGRIQLRKLDSWLEVRRRNAGILTNVLEGLDAIRIPTPKEGVSHAWYKWYCFVRPRALKSGWSRSRLLETINSRGVKCFAGSCPEIYRERAFRERYDGVEVLCPVARELGETSLMLLVHPTLSVEAMNEMASIVYETIEMATR